MKVIAYILSNKTNETEQIKDLHKQKLDIIEYCKKMSYKLVECKQENLNSKTHDVLFNLLAQKNLYDKIIFYSKSNFLEEDFTNWLFEELKNKNIKYDFVYDSEGTKNNADKQTQKKILLNKIKNVPSLPNIVTKTLKIIQNEKSSALQLSRIIRYDLGLTSKILKLVNSPFYGFPKEISSIQHGIAILGFNTIKGLVLSSGIYSNFKNIADAGKFNYQNFWLHTTLCATLSTDLYKLNNKYGHTAEEDEIFSAAILHDIGKLILNQYDTTNYNQVLNEINASVDFEKLLLIEEKHCLFNHQEVGKMVVEAWNLPEAISQCCAYHHNPQKADTKYQEIVHSVYLSNILSTLILTQQKPQIEMFNKSIMQNCHVTYAMIIDKYNEFMTKPEKLLGLKQFFE